MKITLYTTKPKTRAHRVLFDRDLPFRPKAERRRDTYQRRAKNQRHAQDKWGSDD